MNDRQRIFIMRHSARTRSFVSNTSSSPHDSPSLSRRVPYEGNAETPQDLAQENTNLQPVNTYYQTAYYPEYTNYSEDTNYPEDTAPTTPEPVYYAQPGPQLEYATSTDSNIKNHQAESGNANSFHPDSRLRDTQQCGNFQQMSVEAQHQDPPNRSLYCK